MDGQTESQMDAERQHLNLICSTLKQSQVQNFSSICQSMQEKTVYFLYSKYKGGIIPSIIDAN